MPPVSPYPPPPPRPLLRLLVCALLPACVTPAQAGRGGAPAGRIAERAAESATSLPYLLVCAPPSLRFLERAAPPETDPFRPVAGAPPRPDGVLGDIAASNQDAALSLASAPPDASSTDPGAPSPTATTSADLASPSSDAGPGATAATGTPPPPDPTAATSATAPAVPVPAEGPGLSILPDDTPRAIRAEDVLPFFRFPSSGGLETSPTPSSATYQQR